MRSGVGRLLKAHVAARQEDVVAAEARAAADGDVFVHRHGYGRLGRVADLVKDAVGVVIPEEIAAADIVFKVGGLKRTVADAARAVVVVEADTELGIGQAYPPGHGKVLRRRRDLVPARAGRGAGGTGAAAHGGKAVRRHDSGVTRNKRGAALPYRVGGAEAPGQDAVRVVNIDIPRSGRRNSRK